MSINHHRAECICDVCLADRKRLGLPLDSMAEAPEGWDRNAKPTEPTGERCPNCGSSRTFNQGDLSFLECGSFNELTSDMQSVVFHRTEKCRRIELERTVAELRAERDAAVADNAEWRRQVQSIANSEMHESGCCVACGRTGFTDDGSLQHYADCVLVKRHPGEKMLDRLAKLERLAKAVNKLGLCSEALEMRDALAALDAETKP